MEVAVAYHLQEDQCHLMSLSPEETQSCGGNDGKKRPRQPLALSLAEAFSNWVLVCRL